MLDMKTYNSKQHCPYLLVMWLLFSMTFPVMARSQTIISTVPFANILLNPNDMIQASYTFDGHPIIFCYEDNQETTGSIQWPLEGLVQSSTLPITLITDGQYSGEFADPTGTITITNTASLPVVVSCPYGF
jgi:hypothetical protein